MQETEYSVGFELMNGSITAWSSLENRDKYPFGEEGFNRFFQHFFEMSFKFPGDFRCILIYDAKENAPRHSYAIGWIFAEDMDEVNRSGLINTFGFLEAPQTLAQIRAAGIYETSSRYFRTRGEFPKVLGEIRFEYGGGIDTPRITVEKR